MATRRLLPLKEEDKKMGNKCFEAIFHVAKDDGDQSYEHDYEFLIHAKNEAEARELALGQAKTWYDVDNEEPDDPGMVVTSPTSVHFEFGANVSFSDIQETTEQEFVAKFMRQRTIGEIKMGKGLGKTSKRYATICPTKR